MTCAGTLAITSSYLIPGKIPLPRRPNTPLLYHPGVYGVMGLGIELETTPKARLSHELFFRRSFNVVDELVVCYV